MEDAILGVAALDDSRECAARRPWQVQEDDHGLFPARTHELQPSDVRASIMSRISASLVMSNLRANSFGDAAILAKSWTPRTAGPPATAGFLHSRNRKSSFTTRPRNGEFSTIVWKKISSGTSTCLKKRL